MPANPDRPRTAFGAVLAALRLRRDRGIGPFTCQSCDNLQGNGAVLRRTVVSLARASDPDLADWVDANCSFPNSMVDCIVPATGPRELALAREFGIDDAVPVTHENFRQWVIEDDFCAGRPHWDRVGATFSDRVHDYETMKLRMLNAGHQILANPGEILSVETISDCMAHPLIGTLFRKVQIEEIVPHVNPVPDATPEAYLDLLVRRLSNPAIVDTTRRVAFDGSSRHPGFVLPILRDGLRTGAPVQGLALVEALWARMCEGTREDGSVIEPNDPSWDNAPGHREGGAGSVRAHGWSSDGSTATSSRRHASPRRSRAGSVESGRTAAKRRCRPTRRSSRSSRAAVDSRVSTNLRAESPYPDRRFAARTSSPLQLQDQRREGREANLDGVRPAVAFDGFAADATQVAPAPAAILGGIGVDALDPASGRRHADAPRRALHRREVAHHDHRRGVAPATAQPGVEGLLGRVGLDPFEACPFAVQLVECRRGPVEVVEVADEPLHTGVGVLLAQVPVEARVVVPLLGLSEFLAHEEELLAGMPPHEGEVGPQIGEALLLVAGILPRIEPLPCTTSSWLSGSTKFSEKA